MRAIWWPMVTAPTNLRCRSDRSCYRLSAGNFTSIVVCRCFLFNRLLGSAHTPFCFLSFSHSLSLSLSLSLCLSVVVAVDVVDVDVWAGGARRGWRSVIIKWTIMSLGRSPMCRKGAAAAPTHWVCPDVATNLGRHAVSWLWSDQHISSKFFFEVPHFFKSKIKINLIFFNWVTKIGPFWLLLIEF